MTRTQLSHGAQVQEGTELQKNCDRTGKLRRLQTGNTLSLLALRLCLILFSPQVDSLNCFIVLLAKWLPVCPTLTRYSYSHMERQTGSPQGKLHIPERCSGF